MGLRRVAVSGSPRNIFVNQMPNKQGNRVVTNQLYLLQNCSIEKSHTNEDIFFTPANNVGSLQLKLPSVCLLRPVTCSQQLPND